LLHRQDKMLSEESLILFFQQQLCVLLGRRNEGTRELGPSVKKFLPTPMVFSVVCSAKTSK